MWPWPAGGCCALSLTKHEPSLCHVHAAQLRIAPHALQQSPAEGLWPPPGERKPLPTTRPGKRWHWSAAEAEAAALAAPSSRSAARSAIVG